MSNILIMMSGGTSPVINATLAGILTASDRAPSIEKVYAGYPGFQGVLEGSLKDLARLDAADRARLYRTPGSSVIGTTRVAPMEDETLERFAAQLKTHEIDMVINIGGNGTIKQTRAMARALSGRIRFASCPKTVDNDLGDQDYAAMLFTPGFASCANQWIHHTRLFDIENRGAAQHDKILVAQTFGRETGFITGVARIADRNRELPLLILLPEDQQPVDAVLTKLDDTLSHHGRAVVIMSEGYSMGDIGIRRDLSGHVMFGSSRGTNAQLLVDYCSGAGMQARTVIPTVLQRVFTDRVMEFDRDIAFQQGVKTVEALMSGQSEFLMGLYADPAIGVEPIPYETFDDYSRSLPPSFIAPGQFDVSEEYVRYLDSFFAFSRFETGYDEPEGLLVALPELMNRKPA